MLGSRRAERRVCARVVVCFVPSVFFPCQKQKRAPWQCSIRQAGEDRLNKLIKSGIYCAARTASSAEEWRDLTLSESLEERGAVFRENVPDVLSTAFERRIRTIKSEFRCLVNGAWETPGALHPSSCHFAWIGSSEGYHLREGCEPDMPTVSRFRLRLNRKSEFVLVFMASPTNTTLL